MQTRGKEVVLEENNIKLETIMHIMLLFSNMLIGSNQKKKRIQIIYHYNIDMNTHNRKPISLYN